MSNINSRVLHFEIQADDIERAKDFYKKVFNWKIDKYEQKNNTGEEEMMDYWLINSEGNSIPGINGGMYERPKDNKIYTYDCTIGVPDIDKAIEMIKENGGKIIRDKTKMQDVGWFARAVDTEGNVFGLMQSTMK